MDDNTPQSPKSQRPPHGLMPRWLYEEKRKELDTPMDMLHSDIERMYALKGAMKRYIEADKAVPEAWIHELQDTVDHRLYSSMFLN